MPLLKNAIPLTLQENDSELAKLIELFDIASAREIETDKFQPENMSMQDVEKWLAAFGWNQNWQIDRKRLFNALLTMYRYGGTTVGIKKSVREFVGIEVAEIIEDWPFAYANGQTLTDDEKRHVSVRLSNYPYGENTQEYIPIVEQICNHLKPAHAIVTVEIVRNIVADFHMTISSQAGRTIREVAYMHIE